MEETRRYPVGIQTFSRIIRENLIYVDKTDLVWELAHYATYIFMSRPRRFGKSLLTTTLESYFRGEKELFEGLKIMQLEKEWQQYPVIHLDLSTAKGQDSAKSLRETLLWLLKPYAREYGMVADETTPGKLFTGIIKRAYEQAGRQVVIIIDEYDAPLLEVLHEEKDLPSFRKVMQEFYQPLKASEAMIKFCFITGITKFSQLSIFSTINNLTNVTLDPKFSAICGITEEELTTALQKDIERLATLNDLTPEEMHMKLKLRYDGYHFSEYSPEIYNPFSLLKAFQQRKVSNYWFDTGTPSYLIQQLRLFKTDIMSLDRLEAFASDFDLPTEAMRTAIPLLYQSGYLTIKDYERESEMYTLAIPNQEVRIGYTEGLLPLYTGLETRDVRAGFALKFWRALKKGDADLAMREMQAYMAGIPYVEGFKQKLADAATAEGFYEYTMYLIFSMLNVYVRTQVKVWSSESHTSSLEDDRVATELGKAKCAGGRTDMVVWMPDTTYVFELKLNDTAQHALEQIDSKGYAFPYQTGDRRVVKVGVSFDAETRTPKDWIISR